MRVKARAYVQLALQVIPLAESADDLRAWWAAERDHREDYGLTDEQIERLQEACKQRVLALGEKVRS
ncbi:hypothetical protein [Bradyrhizobium sp. SZCCHNRI2010]|uniref:hypothetical protein n=1 Tax=Bradyrhizobium sp. SZCCHNRI2010 TaxID=3057283 RepID=UPI0028EE9FC9|nr:hypothetical protein [Bradyrhizobium sp. SZCCHNRI2010]